MAQELETAHSSDVCNSECMSPARSYSSSKDQSRCCTRYLRELDHLFRLY